MEGTGREVEYLNVLFDFFSDMPEDARARAMEYVRCAEYFLTHEEREALCVDLTPHLPKGCACGGIWELDEPRGERVCVECGLVDVCCTVSRKYLPFDRSFPHTHAYRRSTHFNTTLHALLTQRPPALLLEAVQTEIKRQRADVRKLTHDRMRRLIKATHMQAYYAYTPTLLAAVKEEPLPRLCIAEIDRLHRMFVHVQRAFDEVIPTIDKTRRNFCSYPFLIRKCLQRMGREDLAAHLPQMKTPDKWRKQEQIWSAIEPHL